ncbi:hypothetical protein F5Y00DRAFT_256319 [Daldinia vernicosa]|uniref:uncharacterized protein n=1 Tax=Daldinia vernicosa TaxID=114800 RepID=UPI002008B6A5|nr:uncharacterized protein F5Y00DRAFT_256319 [Daldinia vernicosa]KAI0844061.1 hypothetical protein F5Y00DRAFT_256319 [Daldinia vernicosa]
MDKEPKLSLSPGLGTRAENGYDSILDIMAEMRYQGVDIPPIVRALVRQLYMRAYSAEEHSDRLTGKYQRLQAEHAQLVAEFNRYCKDSKEAWKIKANKILYDDMQKSVDALVDANRESRETIKSMFDENLTMSTEVIALRKEVAELRKENGTLTAKVAVKGSEM